MHHGRSDLISAGFSLGPGELAGWLVGVELAIIDAYVISVPAVCRDALALALALASG